MGPEEREEAAQRLLALTREMLELARAGEWPLFAQREQQRQEISQALFATPVPREAAPVVADCIRRVLDMDQELITQAEEGREQAARAMKETQKGKQAADAYRRFSR